MKSRRTQRRVGKSSVMWSPRSFLFFELMKSTVSVRRANCSIEDSSIVPKEL